MSFKSYWGGKELRDEEENFGFDGTRWRRKKEIVRKGVGDNLSGEELTGWEARPEIRQGRYPALLLEQRRKDCMKLEIS